MINEILQWVVIGILWIALAKIVSGLERGSK
jgi:hypothetical protein